MANATLRRNNLAFNFAKGMYGPPHYGERVRCVSIWASDTHTAAIFAMETDPPPRRPQWHYETVIRRRAETRPEIPLYGVDDGTRPCTAWYAHEHVTALRHLGFRKIA